MEYHNKIEISVGKSSRAGWRGKFSLSPNILQFLHTNNGTKQRQFRGLNCKRKPVNIRTPTQHIFPLKFISRESYLPFRIETANMFYICPQNDVKSIIHFKHPRIECLFLHIFPRYAFRLLFIFDLHKCHIWLMDKTVTSNWDHLTAMSATKRETTLSLWSIKSHQT